MDAEGGNMIIKAIITTTLFKQSWMDGKANFLTKLVLLLALSLTVGASSFAQTPSTYNGVSFSFTLTNGVSEVSTTTFHVGEAILVHPKIDNGSDALFDYMVQDEYYLYRFDLTKAGRSLAIPYRSDRSTLLSIREEDPGIGRKMIPDPIMPNESMTFGALKLADRYDSLVPGTYKLNVEYKTGKIIESNGTFERLRLMYEVSFKVVP